MIAPPMLRLASREKPPVLALQSDAGVLRRIVTRPLRILVADDEPDTVQTLATLLRIEGHEVSESADGRSALEAERSFMPDVVLLDIGMPGVTGYEVAKRVRDRHARRGKRGPLLIAVTCYQQPSDKILARLSGFDHHLGKPFETQELLELLSPLASPAS
jgi:CheY-like chemotaxis protein